MNRTLEPQSLLGLTWINRLALRAIRSMASRDREQAGRCKPGHRATGSAMVRTISPNQHRASFGRCSAWPDRAEAMAAA